MPTIEELMAEKEQIRSKLAGTDEMSADDVRAWHARSQAAMQAKIDSLRTAGRPGERRGRRAAPRREGRAQGRLDQRRRLPHDPRHARP